MNDAKTALGRKILAIKQQRKLSWTKIAERLGYSPTWTCAACLGQMSMTAETAAKAGALFGLNDEEVALLQQSVSRIAARRGADRPADLPVL
jgi:cyanate lyase